MRTPLVVQLSLPLVLSSLIHAPLTWSREDSTPAGISIEARTPTGARVFIPRDSLDPQKSDGDPTTLAYDEKGHETGVVTQDIGTDAQASQVPTLSISCGSQIRFHAGQAGASAQERTAMLSSLLEVIQPDLPPSPLKGLGVGPFLNLPELVLQKPGASSNVIEEALRTQEVQNQKDQETLSQPYVQRPLPLAELQERMDRAITGLERQSELLSEIPLTEAEIGPADSDASNSMRPSEDTLSSAEAYRYRRLLSDALDRAKETQQVLKELELSPETLRDPEILSKTPATRELFPEKTPRITPPPITENNLASSAALSGPTQSKKRSTPSHSDSDALINRMLYLEGLKPEERQKALGAIGNQKTFKNGLVLLNNGEPGSINTVTAQTSKPKGSKAPTFESRSECERTAVSLVAQALSPELRQLELSSADYRAIWIYRKTGFFPKVPKYSEKRKKQIQRVADEFDAIDLYQREPLREGDLLVHRLAWEPSGRTYVIRNYDLKTYQAGVLEVGSGDRIQVQRNLLKLALSSPKQPNRLLASLGKRHLPTSPAPIALEPGYYALRLRPVQVQRCESRKLERAPSANTERPATTSQKPSHPMPPLSAARLSGDRKINPLQDAPGFRQSKRFRTAKEALLHYTARDAHGFYWVGMKRSERESVTTWDRSPSSEGAYLISRYELGQEESINSAKTQRVRIPVTYHLVGHTDLQGVITPPTRYTHVLSFELEKAPDQEHWRIISPASEQVFPYVHYFGAEGLTEGQ